MKDFYDGGNVFFREIGTTRETQTLLEYLVRDAAAAVAVLAEDRLEVQGLPGWPRFNVFRFQGQSYIFSTGAKLVRVNRETR
jgi:hypothetical protein